MGIGIRRENMQIIVQSLYMFDFKKNSTKIRGLVFNHIERAPRKV